MIRATQVMKTALFLCGFMLVFSMGYFKAEASQEQSTTVRDAREDVYNFDVRVLLDKELVGSGVAFAGWSITSRGGFMAFDPKRGISEKLATEELIISVREGHLALNGRRLRSNRVAIQSCCNAIGYGKNRYAGTFEIELDTDGWLYLVNRLDIEDYLYSVVRWESVPTWPLEANKAMAITCRTYLVNKVINARRQRSVRSYHYDIRATNINQTYRGLHNFPQVRRAVDETRGVVMVYKGKPIEAMYDACCGGIVPARMSGVSFDKAPYLKRTERCMYCRKCKLFEWQKEYRLTDFQDVLRAEGEGNVLPVRDIKISKKDSSGVVHEMQIRTDSSWYALKGQRIYNQFKGLKSMAFSIFKKGKRVIFKGHGFGHMLGLCQWGAYRMALDGWTYEEILRFYYCGISFTTIRVADR